MKKVLSLFLTAVIILSCFTAAAVSANAASKLSPGYYVVGTMNNWTLDKAYRMQSEEYDRGNDAGEYYVLKGVKLDAGDELKVVYSEDGVSKNAWYPDSGPLTNYVVYEESYYNISLALHTDGTIGAWDWQLWVEPCEAPIDKSVYPTEPEPIDHTKELWESGAVPTAEDIEEAANIQHKSRERFSADKIHIFDSYRFDHTPAYVVDYMVEGYYYYTVILNQRLGDYLLYSTSSYEPSVYAGDKLTDFTKAYGEGILTDDMLAELAEADYRCGNRCRIVTRYITGDADGDGDVNVVDATVIQRGIAHIMDDGDYYKPLADVDRDSDVSIVDATLIQRHNAGLYAIE